MFLFHMNWNPFDWNYSAIGDTPFCSSVIYQALQDGTNDLVIPAAWHPQKINKSVINFRTPSWIPLSVHPLPSSRCPCHKGNCQHILHIYLHLCASSMTSLRKNSPACWMEDPHLLFSFGLMFSASLLI
jgi:hypothetical protein